MIYACEFTVVLKLIIVNISIYIFTKLNKELEFVKKYILIYFSVEEIVSYFNIGFI